MADDGGELIKEGQFIGAFSEGALAGAWLVKPWNNITYEIHGGVHPDYWGDSEPLYRAMGIHLFKFTPCLKLIAIIPSCNPLVRKMAIRLGMAHEGTVKDSFQKNWKLYDQFIYGITKGDALCQRP